MEEVSREGLSLSAGKRRENYQKKKRRGGIPARRSRSQKKNLPFQGKPTVKKGGENLADRERRGVLTEEKGVIMRAHFLP